MPPVIAIFGNLQVHRRTIVGNATTARLDQMANGSKRPHVVVYHHARRVHARTYTVVEDHGDAMVHEFREVVIALRVLGLGDDDAAGAVLIEGLADLYLAVVALVARGDQDAVAPFPGRLLDTRENGGEIVVDKLGDDDSDELRRLRAALAQRLCQRIGREMMFARKPLDGLSLFRTDARIILQRTGNGRY